MKKSEIEILKEQNEILKTALQDIVDYHHHIGNSDCPYTITQIHNNLYKLATNGLKDSEEHCVNENEYVEPIFGFTSAQLLADFNIITSDYNKKLNNNL